MKTPKYIKHFLPVVLLFAIQAFVCGQPKTTAVTLTYPNPGTYTFTIPIGGTADGQIWGGGGGGGAAKAIGSGHYGAAAAGGGGGGYSTASSLMGNLTIIVGAGGAGGTITSTNVVYAATAGQSSSINVTVAGGGGGGGSALSNGSSVANSAYGVGGTGNYNSGANGTAGITSGSGGTSNIIGGSGGAAGGVAFGGGLGVTGGTNSGVATNEIYPGPLPNPPGGGAPGAAVKINPSNPSGLSLYTPGHSGADGKVVITLDVIDLAPILTGPSSDVCAGNLFQLSVENPVLGRNYELYQKATDGVSPDIFVVTLNSLNNHTYTKVAAVTDAGDYYIITDFFVDAPGAIVTADADYLQSAPYTLTIRPQFSIPVIRWSFDGICPIDESEDDEIFVWKCGSGTETQVDPNDPPFSYCVPDSSSIENYFANLIQWDSIVWQPGLDLDQLIWYDAATGGNILKQNGMLTPAGLALQAIGKFSDFWQNESQEEEIYWVSIAGNATHCESDRRRVRVLISGDVISVSNICIALYTQEGEELSWYDVVANNIDIDEDYEGLWWYANEEDANAAYLFNDSGNDIPEPDPVDLTVTSDQSYWAIRYDKLDDETIECLSQPFEVSITVLERPDAKLWINTIGNNIDTLCVEDYYELIIQFTAGTSPWEFSGFGQTITISEEDFNTEICDSCYIAERGPALASPPPQTYNYNITSITDANANMACFFDDPGYVYQYQGNAQRSVFAQPVVGTISSVSPVCEGEELTLPTPPLYNSNSGDAYTSGWLVNGDTIKTIPYTPTIDDNGKPLRYFVSNHCGTAYSNSVTVTVNVQPEISVTSTTICSGDTLHIQLNDPTLPGTYTVTVIDDGGNPGNAVASVSPEGIISTDIDSEEGAGGEVDVMFTSVAGCISNPITITITPRAKTPGLRWTYDGICPVDESADDEISVWICGGATEGVDPPRGSDDPPFAGCVPDSTQLTVNYFANFIRWDYLVDNGVPEDDEFFYTTEPGDPDYPFTNIIWYDAPTGGNRIQIGGELTFYGLALQAAGKFMDFWQNEPHDLEIYWAAILNEDSCESHRIPVEVNIFAAPEELDHTDFAAYVQPGGTFNLLSDFLLNPIYNNIHLDATQKIEWYETEEDAYNAFNNYNETDTGWDDNVYDIDTEPSPAEPFPFPTFLDLTQPIDTTFWLIKADIFGCRSLPTHFRIQLFPMPSISIEPDTVVCAGGATTVRVEINGGTPPYNFEITNSNTSDVISQIDYDDDSFSFTIHPLIPVSYYISDFSDLYTDSVTYLPFGLFPPAGQDYFDDANILVIITEILVITPNEGPVVGGTFTGDPNNPVDPNGIITIIGYGFNAFGEEPLVMFEDRPATNVTVYDQYTITCTPPAHPSGYVAVSVITACGTFTFNNGYLYNSMDIAGVSPAYSPVTGGTVVTIQGVGFLSAAELADDVTVTFCGVPATIISVADNQIVCQTGVSSYSQLGDIDIFNGTETSTFAGRFTYYPVVFIKNGLWSEAYNWETQTDDRILPYPNAVIHIKANCLQDIDLRSGGSFPYGQAMDSITVYPNKAYTLGTGRMLDANVFTLKDDASFLNYGNMNATQQNVEHLLTQGRNWYISSPLEILSGSLTANRDWIEQYDETTHLWQRPGTGLTVGCGYTIFSAAEDIALKYSGTYNDGNRMSPGLTRQNDAHPKRGFNLVGNPFPSYWRWTAAAASNANVYSTIWYRTNVAGVYEFWSYNASGDVAAMPGWEDATPTGSYSLAYIPPIQAFWVRILDGQSAGTLTFTNNNRAHADHSSNVLKSAETQSTETRPLLRLVVNNGVRADETVIYADPKAKNGFDTYDSDKWFTNQGAEIFTLPVSSTRELVINGLSEIKDSTEVTLGFQANEGGAFNFRAKEILNLDAFDVFLSDKWRKIEFDLRDGDYNFTSSSVSVTDRFSIIFRRNADMSTKDAGDNLLAYTDKNGQVIVILNLRNQQGNDVNVSVFDIIGRKLTEQPVIVGERTILKGTFPRGVYVLRSGKCVTKIQISSSQP